VESGIIVAGCCSAFTALRADYHALLFEQWASTKISSRPSSASSSFTLRSLRPFDARHAANSSRASFKLSPPACLLLGLIFLLLPKTLLGYAEQEGRCRNAQGVPTTAMVLTLGFHDLLAHVIHCSPPSALSREVLIVGAGTPSGGVAREVLERRDLGLFASSLICETAR